MKTYKQKTPNDCAIACFKMITGRRYNDVLKTVGDEYEPGKGLRSVQISLERLGFGDDDFFRHIRPFLLSPEYFRRLAWGRKALLTVPSLNIKDGWHMVYYDGKKLHDPSTKKTYKRFEDLKPEQIVVFQEGLL